MDKKKTRQQVKFALDRINSLWLRDGTFIDPPNIAAARKLVTAHDKKVSAEKTRRARILSDARNEARKDIHFASDAAEVLAALEAYEKLFDKLEHR